MTDVRKNLIIIISLLSGILLVLLFLNLNPSWKNQGAEILDSQNTDPTNLPKKISRGAVRFFDFKGGSDRIIFYEEADSIIYEAASDGRDKKELARIPDASEIVFSPDGKELIATIYEKGDSGKAYFNLENNRKAELHKNIKSVAFSPDGKKLAYYFYDDKNGEGNISISKPDGSDFENIFRTRISDLSLAWPEPELIIFRPKNKDDSLIFSITPGGKEFRRLAEKESTLYHLGLETKEKLSPLGDYRIFLNADDGKLYSLKLQ